MSVFSSCDSAYDVKYIFENNSEDNVVISFRYHKSNDSSVVVLPHERKTFLTDYVIRKASTFVDCCPCNFEFISTNNTAVEINAANK